MFIKLAFEFGCVLILRSYLIMRSLGGELHKMDFHPLISIFHKRNMCRLIANYFRQKAHCGKRKLMPALASKSGVFSWFSWSLNFSTKMMVFPHPVPQILQSQKQGHIVVVFYIRASYWLPFLPFHDNRASHSRDTIWPWKFKVKGQGRRYPSQCSVQLIHILSVSHQGIYWFPSLSFHDNQASHSRDTFWT